MAINCCIEQGRFTSDPEVRHTQSGKAVVSFTIAVNGYRDGDVTFVDCTAWDKTAEFIGQYFRKGQEIIVRGELQQREWTTKDGEKRKRTEVNVREAYFCGSRSDSGQASARQNVNVQRPANDYEEVAENDDDLPF